MADSLTSVEVGDKAAELIDREGGFSAFVQNVIFGGISYAFGLQAIDGISSFGDLILGPPRALGLGLIGLVDFIFQDMMFPVLDAGTQTTVQSFLDGTASLLGPFAQPAALGTFMITIFVFMFAINNVPFSPLSFIKNLRK